MALSQVGLERLHEKVTRKIGQRKNLVINGSMQFAQRGASVTGLSSSNKVQALDRMFCRINGAGTWTISQSTEAPAGFGHSLKWDCTTADTNPAASDFNYISQRFEGQNLQHLAKGTSGAVQTTLSFHVKSYVTGTFAVLLTDNDNTRQVGATYTISAADTWEKKTITFPGDTTGALDDDAAHSMNIIWWMVVGTDRTSGTAATTWESSVTANAAVGHDVNMASSTSNEFYITGIQWEVGSTATDFEQMTPGEEKQLCMRYFQIAGARHCGAVEGTTQFRILTPLEPEMRSSPTTTVRSGKTFNTRYQGDTNITNPTLASARSEARGIWTGISTSGKVAGTPIYGRMQQGVNGDFLDCEAEL